LRRNVRACTHRGVGLAIGRRDRLSKRRHLRLAARPWSVITRDVSKLQRGPTQPSPKEASSATAECRGPSLGHTLLLPPSGQPTGSTGELRPLRTPGKEKIVGPCLQNNLRRPCCSRVPASACRSFGLGAREAAVFALTTTSAAIHFAPHPQAARRRRRRGLLLGRA